MGSGIANRLITSETESMEVVLSVSQPLGGWILSLLSLLLSSFFLGVTGTAKWLVRRKANVPAARGKDVKTSRTPTFGNSSCEGVLGVSLGNIIFMHLYWAWNQPSPLEGRGEGCYIHSIRNRCRLWIKLEKMATLKWHRDGTFRPISNSNDLRNDAMW